MNKALKIDIEKNSYATVLNHGSDVPSRPLYVCSFLR